MKQDTQRQRHKGLFDSCHSFAAYVLLLIALLLPTEAFAERSQVLEPLATSGGLKRVALVIGNGAYQSIPALDNTVEDARDVAVTAQKLGYRVFLAEDLNRMSMNRQIADFLLQIEPGTEVLLYYSGHGVELQGANYLFPIDTPMLSSEQDRLLRSEAINLSDLLSDFQARSARVTLVILDACRDNPFATSGRKSLGKTRGLGDVAAPDGTFVIYAAGAGEAALDNLGPKDTSKNGLFTRSLLKLMDREGMELRSMVRELRQEVRLAALTNAGHSQTPSYYDQLLGDFYFRPPRADQNDKAQCEALVKPDATKEAVLFGDYANIISVCQRVVMTDPSDARMTGLLQVAREQLAVQQALNSTAPSLGQAYLSLYPSGRYRADIEEYLRRLGAVVGPVPSPTPVTPMPDISAIALAKSIQEHLTSVGCYMGSADGRWGDKSRQALTEFARHSGIQVASLEPSTDLLEKMKPLNNRICPQKCSPRERLEGGRCVRKTCAKGQVLTSGGACEARRVERIVKPKPTPRKGGGKVQRKASGGGGCFMFNGSRICE